MQRNAQLPLVLPALGGLLVLGFALAAFRLFQHPLATLATARVAPLTNVESIDGLPPPLVEISSELQPRVEQLITALRANPDGFDYENHHHLRHCFYEAGDFRRMAYLCEVLLAHHPYDEYTLNCMGAFDFNGPKIPEMLARWYAFPEYRRVRAACRLKTAEVSENPDKAEAILAEVERMEGEEIAPYRKLVPSIRAKLAQRNAATVAVEAPPAEVTPPAPDPQAALAREAAEEAYRKFLDDLRRNGQVDAAQRIEQRVQEIRPRVDAFPRGANLIIGRVVVDGPHPVELVQSQMRIHPDGYFVSDVGEIGKPIGFRLEGYQPVDLVTGGVPGQIVLVGEVRLKRLDPADRVSLKGIITVEGQTRVHGVKASLRLRTELINNSTGGYEGDRGLPGPVVRISPSGELSATGLTPAGYHLYVEKPGYWPQFVPIPYQPGQEMDAGKIALELTETIQVTYIAPRDKRDRPFQGVKPTTTQFLAPEGFLPGAREDRMHLLVRITRHDGRVWIDSNYGPFTVRDLGPGSLADFLDLDVSTIPESYNQVPPEAGHVYLGHWSYPEERFVLFAIDSIEKANPNTAQRRPR